MRDLRHPVSDKSNSQIRFAELQRCKRRFLEVQTAIVESTKLSEELYQSQVLHISVIEGRGEEELRSIFWDFFFHAREILKSIFLRLNKKAAGDLPNDKKFFNGSLFSYDIVSVDPKTREIQQFLKTNFTILFHIRELRNLIKESPSQIGFRINNCKHNEHIEAEVRVPLARKSVQAVFDADYFLVKNKDDARKNDFYRVTITLNYLFDQIIDLLACMDQLDR